MRLVCAGCGRTADIQVNTDVDARTLKGTVLRTVETAGWTHTNGFDKLHCPQCSDRAFETDMYEAMKSLVGKARDGAWRGRALGDDTKRDIKRMADDLVSILRLNEEGERMSKTVCPLCGSEIIIHIPPYHLRGTPYGHKVTLTCSNEDCRPVDSRMFGEDYGMTFAVTSYYVTEEYYGLSVEDRERYDEIMRKRHADTIRKRFDPGIVSPYPKTEKDEKENRGEQMSFDE